MIDLNSNVENFLSGTDHFEKISVVPSRLCRGDREAIPNPYITIAIPTYRRNDLLKWSMESALAQENPGCEYEVVVVDNEGSSSETATGAVVRSFQDGRLLYYKNQKNLGMFGNFNRCIELARGEWVAFLHDDDMLRPTYLRDVCQLLKRKKHIGGIVADTIDIDNSLSVGIKEKLSRWDSRDLSDALKRKSS